MSTVWTSIGSRTVHALPTLKLLTGLNYSFCHSIFPSVKVVFAQGKKADVRNLAATATKFSVNEKKNFALSLAANTFFPFSFLPLSIQQIKIFNR